MKILIFTKNWLGDILFEFPALQAIQEHYPNAEIVCAAPERCIPMLRLHPAVRRIIPFDEKEKERSLWKKIQWILKIRKERWDLAVLFHRSRTRALIAFFLGAKERIGYARGRKSFLTTAVEEPSQAMHQVDYFSHLLKESGIPATATHYQIRPPEEAREKIQEFLNQEGLSRFVCFHLGANWEPKRWSLVHFATLAEILWRRWEIPVVLTGGTQDQLLADQWMSLVRKAKSVNYVGQTNLAELSALYEKSLFVISGDSGPMHVASAVGARVIALFGPTDPKLTGPRGIGEVEIIQYIPEGHKVPWIGSGFPSEGWLSKITPDSVVEVLEKKKWVPADRHCEESRLGGTTKQSDSKTRLLRSFQSLAMTEKDTNHPPQILFISLSNLGDCVLTTPVLMSLKQRFPDAQFHIVTGPRAAGIFQNNPLISRLLIYDKKKDWLHQWKFLRLLRAENYDWVVDLRNTAIPFLVRSKKRSPILRFYKKTAMRDRHLEVLEWMGLSPNGGAPPFNFFTEKESEKAIQKLKEKGVSKDQDTILVAAVAASELKTWKLEGFEAVLKKLIKERPETILLVGDQREREKMNPLTEIDSGRVINLAGELSVRETASLISRASLLLTNDSALMHLGYELDRPVVSVFGPTHHEKYGRTGPHFRTVRAGVACSPCEKPLCKFSRQHCFEDLDPERVYEACKELLTNYVPATE